jgi:anti-sigma28 factor (negative regulator of flagellin synthesis)
MLPNLFKRINKIKAHMSSKKQSRPSTASSPQKKGSAPPKRSAEVEVREKLNSGHVEESHQSTTEYLIIQHKELVDDLRRDIQMLREENTLLK